MWGEAFAPGGQWVENATAFLHGGSAGWPGLLLCRRESCFLPALLVWARGCVLRGTQTLEALRCAPTGCTAAEQQFRVWSDCDPAVCRERLCLCQHGDAQQLRPLQLVYAKGSATRPHPIGGIYRECQSGGATLTCQINHLSFSLHLVKGQESLQGPEIH